MKTIIITHDPDCENPLINDCVIAYIRLGARTTVITKKDVDSLELCVFKIDRYGHGDRIYGLSGEVPQCRWDTVKNYGELALIKSEVGDDPASLARAILDDYTNWVTGTCFSWALIETTHCQCCGAATEETLDACHGYIGLKVAVMEAEASHPDIPVKLPY